MSKPSLFNPQSLWVATYIGDPWGEWNIGVKTLQAEDLPDVMNQLLNDQDAKGLGHDELWAPSVVHVEPFEVFSGVWQKEAEYLPETDEITLPFSVTAIPFRRRTNSYVISGFDGVYPGTFAQWLYADSVEEAVDLVTTFFKSKGYPEALPWSAVEYLPNGTVNVWWLIETKPGKGSVMRDTPKLCEALLKAAVGSSPPSGVETKVESELDFINRHRASIYQPPLDPIASGWGPDDLKAEAERISRLPNPARPELGEKETLLVLASWESHRGEGPRSPTPGHRIGKTWAVTRHLELDPEGKWKPGRQWDLTHLPSGLRAFQGTNKKLVVGLGQRVVELGYDGVYAVEPAEDQFPGLETLIRQVEASMRADESSASILRSVNKYQTTEFGELSQMEFGGCTP